MKDLTELTGKSEKVELIGRPVSFFITKDYGVEKIQNEISKLAPENADSYNPGWLFNIPNHTNNLDQNGCAILIQYCRKFHS